MLVDLTAMPIGQTYEDRYQGYLDVFKRIATAPGHVSVLVKRPPYSWVPLLVYLNCSIEDPQMYFAHCSMVRGALTPVTSRGEFVGHYLDRTAVEVLTNFRPECADALWKIDMQWDVAPGRVRRELEREFIVTTNGAFHRPEVKAYLKALDAYQPTKKKVVLVPCAADKPYPSPLHNEVLIRLPRDFYMMNATGVVGLVPQDLWPIMPWYDSGIPNRWRLYEMVKKYFTEHEHECIVVYCDFYAYAIREALRSIGQDNRAHYILPVQQYDDYVDLMMESRLLALQGVLHRLGGDGPTFKAGASELIGEE